MAALAAIGCARLPTLPEGVSQWTGRLSVRLDGNPVQLWTAAFRLVGTPQTGQLDLYGPLGATLAQARWTPGLAVLDQGREQRQYATMDDLTEDLLGERVPMQAFYDWLTLAARREVPGWQVDDSRRDRGLLRASRPGQPDAPAVLLTVVLDPR